VLATLIECILEFLLHFWIWGGDLHRPDLTLSPVRQRTRKRRLLFACLAILVLVVLGAVLLAIFA
jgi:hypothetical protein